MAIAFDLVGQQWQRKIIVIAAAAVGVALLISMQSASPEGAYWHEAIERIGIILILVGIIGRTWCAMYIGGNKLNRLVTEGPYSLTRNPLYVFSAIAAFGLGAQIGSVVFALICATATLVIFTIVIRHEERALAERFPAEFARYKARVPRLTPDFKGWQDAETILVRPALVHRTFWDAMLFLLAVPGLKLLESLRSDWAIEPLISLY